MTISPYFKIKFVKIILVALLAADIAYITTACRTFFERNRQNSLVLDIISPRPASIAMKDSQSLGVVVPEIFGKFYTHESYAPLSYRFPLSDWDRKRFQIETSDPETILSSAKIISPEGEILQDIIIKKDGNFPNLWSLAMQKSIVRPSFELTSEAIILSILLAIHILWCLIFLFKSKEVLGLTSTPLLISIVLSGLVSGIFLKEDNSEIIAMSWQQKVSNRSTNIEMEIVSSLHPSAATVSKVATLSSGEDGWKTESLTARVKKPEELSIRWTTKNTQLEIRNLRVNSKELPDHCIYAQPSNSHVSRINGVLSFSNSEAIEQTLTIGCIKKLPSEKYKKKTVSWILLCLFQVISYLLVNRATKPEVMQRIKTSAPSLKRHLFNKSSSIFTWMLYCSALSMFFLIHRSFVFVDELDNLAGGAAVFRGGEIYKNFLSQHTPFAYYLVSGMYHLGIEQLEGFRLCFAAILLSFFIFSGVRYRAICGNFTFPLLAIIYAYFAPIFWGHMILSNTLSAFAAFWIFLELLKIIAEKNISLISALIISISCFIAPMSAILSAFHLIPLLTFLTIAILSKKIALFKDSSIEESFPLKVSLFIFIGLIPYTALIIKYSLNENIGNFIYQSITFNREYYSKYNGGIGQQHALAPLIEFPIAVYVGHFWNLLTNVNFKLIPKELEYPILLVFSVCNLLLIFYWAISKRFVNAILWAIFLGYSQYRGASGLHAMPYVLPSLFSSAYLASKGLTYVTVPRNSRKALIIPLLVPYLVLLFLGQTSFKKYAGKDLDKESGYLLNSHFAAQVAKKLTTKEDIVYDVGLDLTANVGLNRKCPGKFCGIVPWAYECFKKEYLSDIEKYRPKVIFMDPESDIWGYKLADYAKELVAFIRDHYTQIDNEHPEYYRVWVDPSFKPIARRLLDSRQIDGKAEQLIKTNADKKGGCYVNTLRFIKKIRQTLTPLHSELTSIDLNFATYGKSDLPLNLFLSTFDANNRVVSYSLKNDVIIKDNQWVRFEMKKTSDSIPSYFEIEIQNPNDKDFTLLSSCSKPSEKSLFLNEEAQPHITLAYKAYSNDQMAIGLRK